MPNLFAKYESDPVKELEGVELEVDGCFFMCRRAGGGNRRYRMALSLASLEVRDKIESKELDDQLEGENEATLLAFARTVVIGWREVQDREGNPWPFTPENFLELMRACPDVWAELRFQGRNIENFRLEKAQVLGADLGNSLSGTSSGETTSSDSKLSPKPDSALEPSILDQS